MALEGFHPAVRRWFGRRFERATAVQGESWAAIARGEPTLIAAPTGSGKTLAAFLATIDSLVREGLEQGLANETYVLYVSPLKALSNDIQVNLQEPLAGIREELAAEGLPDVDVRAWVRTGDTPPGEREQMRRHPPHILVTTPESLFILLTSESGRRMLSTVRTAIVDEIHAVAGSKRGAHLGLSLERLGALCEAPPLRVGLSATQRPIERIADFLMGGDTRERQIIDTGHARERDLALEVPRSPLEAVMANEVWDEQYDRLAELIAEHGTTLIFANTRRLAERAAKNLAERLGDDQVGAHHGSLAREQRLQAERRLKAGELQALVATASLELGIDVGHVDLVCQLGSPRAIATFLQRVGRSGHALAATPKGRLFPLTRDDLVECTALLDAARRGALDEITIPEAPLDVLAQQMVGELAGAGEWAAGALYETFTRAYSYRGLPRERFDAVVGMLADGYTTRRGRRRAYVHRDAVHDRLRPRRAARIAAMTNAGTIPDQFDYDVVLSPEGLRIGTLNEDFAYESLPGDIFQLGNRAYRMLKIEQGRVHVEDAGDQPPNLPFWFGEAPGRTPELSEAVAELRAAVDARLAETGEAAQWLSDNYGLPRAAARQLADYLAAARAALGVIPTQRHLAIERFFDANQDTHLVIHAPFGSRINRAWGLALRKRFCRRFNFELQAAADENAIVLSLGATHSFPLDEVLGYLKADVAEEVLTQALLDSPMFEVRWRWNASTALAVLRRRGSQRVPAQIQRSDAEDLIAVVFPDQLACAENLAGQREIPDHPLVQQTVHDCLHEAMDVDGLRRVLAGIEADETRVSTHELTGPSPLAHEIVEARPYTFLDDTPQEERRTHNIQAQRALAEADAARLGQLDPEAIARVREEAWPAPRDVDETHDALVVLGFVTVDEAEAGGWTTWLDSLAADARAARAQLPGGAIWVAAERLAEILAVAPTATLAPRIDPAPRGPTETLEGATDPETALRELLRSRLEGVGPNTAEALAAPLGLNPPQVATALLALEHEGFVMRGHFDRDVAEEQWCERGLLARIHRYTLRERRSRFKPVSPASFMRFLLHWHGLGGDRAEGEEALAGVIEQLEGCALPAGAWESDVLPRRVADYRPEHLDRLCTSGRVVWLRLSPPRHGPPGQRGRSAGPVRHTPVALLPRATAAAWTSAAGTGADDARLSSPAQRVQEALREQGASFYDALRSASGLLDAQLEEALGELVAAGLVTCDSFAGLRALLLPAERRVDRRRRGRPRSLSGSPLAAAGRWSLTEEPAGPAANAPEADGLHPRAEVEHVARCLLRRYGVVFRRLLDREGPLPPWRDLLYVYRRLEARGEIHGGRFVDGFSGEQFALPEAAGALGKTKGNGAEDFIALSAADPLNLTGIVTPGPRVPAQATNRLLFRGGSVVAIQQGREIRYLSDMDDAEAWRARTALERRGNPAGFVERPGTAG